MKSRLAAACAASVVAATVAAIPLAPVVAVSDPQGEVCSVPGFPAPVKLTTQVDTDAPDEIFAGTTRDVAVTSLVTLPAEVVDSLRADGAASVGGTSDAVVSVSNADRDVTLAITPAALPAATGTPMVLSATGPAGSIGPGEPNSGYSFWIGDFTLHVKRYLADGSSAGAATTITCSFDFDGGRPDGVVVYVVAKPTTVSFKNLQPVELGDRPRVTVVIGTPGWNGTPEGIVDFNLDGVKVKASVIDGVATATMPRTTIVGYQSLGALFRPADPYVAMKYHDVGLRVVRDDSISHVSAVHRGARGRLVVDDRVVAEHGSAVSGMVKLEVRRNGVSLKQVIVELDRDGRLHRAFGHVGTHGRYVVVATYLGSSNLERSVDRIRLVV